jgi:hypothetical protein
VCDGIVPSGIVLVEKVAYSNADHACKTGIQFNTLASKNWKCIVLARDPILV